MSLSPSLAPHAGARSAAGLATRLAPWLGSARCRWNWRRPGTVPVAIGSLALLAAAGLGLLLVPRWQADTLAAGQALHWRASTARLAPAPLPPPPGPARRLQAALPAAAQTPLRVAELWALAQRHDIAVTSARQSPAAGTGIDAVPLAWRAQGRYADLRAFVAAALQADPGLVLDQLRLSRADGRTLLLDADLQWQLLQQAEPARPVQRADATTPRPAR